MHLYPKDEFIGHLFSSDFDADLFHAGRNENAAVMRTRLEQGASVWSLVNVWIECDGTLIRTLDIAETLPQAMRIEIHRVARSLALLKKRHTRDEYELWLERAAGLWPAGPWPAYDVEGEIEAMKIATR